MNTKHTPGPWSIEPAWSKRGGSDVAIVNRNHPGDDWDVCVVHSTEANARLIAAAPELLEMLIEARKEFAGLPRSLGYDFTHLPKLDALIAKATGEQA